MSNHDNNTRQPIRRPSNAYARYINGNRVNFDFISPPSLPFPPTLNERIAIDPWLWSLPERNLTLPSSMISFPRPRMQLVVFRNNVADNINMWSRPTEQSRQQHSELTPNEQRQALKMLKKEIFNPTPKKIIRRIGRYYKQNDATKAYGDQKTDKGLEEDDDDKKCVICLEDFEAREVVMVTPCKHMFHEDCILPWVKSSGKCPVCRFSFCESNDESGASSTNEDNLVDDRLINDLVSFVTSRGSSTTMEPFWF
ncbi:hypothetical protein L1987_12741 [Smallanthus sonchifolius]|uniref:Uncharacterized protein n=1 Tax=Smallanthus sonchifolius TaxID=185202 RepID=A0ACB9JGP3_9ASTR|nr:hypothetical protein L1987_12741 [Smallanthus sonchifolius]